MKLARDIWSKYENAIARGHLDYCRQAKKCESFYLGEQWSQEDIEYLNSQGRPLYAFNEIKQSIDHMISYQINNRMEPVFKPAGGASDGKLAVIHTKTFKHIAVQNDLHHKETLVFSDGLIQQRGYFEVLMDYEHNIFGEVKINVLDPMDVIPDPDSNSYNPEDWKYVLIQKDLTLDEIELLYGKALRDKVEAEEMPENLRSEWNDSGITRNNFSNSYSETPQIESIYGYGDEAFEVKRYKVIDCQRYVYEMGQAIVYPTGESVSTAGMTQGRIQEMLSLGGFLQKKMMRKVKWTVATRSIVLRDDISPYKSYSVVMFSPVFRRGRTLGVVDNAIDYQEMLNKFISQQMHVMNTGANGGWIVEEGSITNMDIDEFTQRASETGIVVELRRGATPPQKIGATQLPTGLDSLAEFAKRGLRESTVPDSARGIQSNERSGVAVQSRQIAAQSQMAGPLDNLALTRKILTRKVLELVQMFYDNPRVIRITEIDPMTGKDYDELLNLNQETEEGFIQNDLTIGKYDVLITEQPMRHTYDASQFEQLVEMKQYGIQIPDEFVIRASNLSEKFDILEAMAKQKENQQPDPMQETQLAIAKAQESKIKAEIDKIRAATFETNMKGLYSGLQTGIGVLQDMEVASVANEIATSAGFVDMLQTPAYDNGAPQDINGPAGIDIFNGNQNTDTLSPAIPVSPAEGYTTGIERQGPN